MYCRYLCILRPLPDGEGRFGASLAGNMLCGGTTDSSKQRACWQFDEGMNLSLCHKKYIVKVL